MVEMFIGMKFTNEHFSQPMVKMSAYCINIPSGKGVEGVEVGRVGSDKMDHSFVI